MAQGQANDPFRNFAFRLKHQNQELGAFTRCTGLSLRVSPIAYREGGGDPATLYQLPGRVEYGEVTLSWGLSESVGLWTWVNNIATRKLVANNTLDFRTVSIQFVGTDGITPKFQYSLESAWPSSWHSPDLDALGNGVAIECLSLCFSRLTREAAG